MENKRTSTYFLFSDMEPIPFKYVHPLQLKKVKQLSKIKFPTYVKYLMLFGSSLDLTCTQGSDLDLYFIVDEGFQNSIESIIELHGLCSLVHRHFDLLISSEDEFYESSDSINSVEHRILERGAIIYEREKECKTYSA
jgi:predicted nucleotidyltransferase